MNVLNEWIDWNEWTNEHVFLWHPNDYGERVLITVHFGLGSPEGEQWASAFLCQYYTRGPSHMEQKGRNAQKEERRDKIVFMLISLTVSNFPSRGTYHNPTSEPQKKMYLWAIHNKVVSIMDIWAEWDPKISLVSNLMVPEGQHVAWTETIYTSSESLITILWRMEIIQ